LKSDGYGYTYSIFEELTTEDLKILKEDKITDARIYVYDSVIIDGNRLKEYIKILTK
jgi:hypothetical protein